jgi:hypothetical protein
VPTLLLDILSLSWTCTSGNFASEEGHLSATLTPVLGLYRYPSQWLPAADSGDVTYELAYAPPREATVAAKLTLACQLNSWSRLVLEDLNSCLATECDAAVRARSHQCMRPSWWRLLRVVVGVEGEISGIGASYRVYVNLPEVPEVITSSASHVPWVASGLQPAAVLT